MSWQSAVDALNAIRFDPSSSTAARSLADRTRIDLSSAGQAFDTAFARLGLPSVLTESSAHETWRTSAMPSALETLDALAASVDGGPPTVISDVNEAREVILARLEAAAADEGASEAARAVVSRALASVDVALPREPPFYRAEYYRKAGGIIARFTYGELEHRLAAVQSEADAFLAMVAP